MHSIEDHISIQTTQQIELEHSLASIGERVLASIIDYFVILGIFLLGALVAGIAGITYLWFIFIIPAFLYQLIMDMIYNGQSVGKRIMKIKIVKLDGSNASFFTWFIRWTFRLIDINLSLGAVGTLTIILNSKGQRVGDMAAGTCVVRLVKNPGIQSMLVELPAGYEPQFNQVKNLNDNDLKTLREVVDMWNQSLDFTDVDLSEAGRIVGLARHAFEKKLNIDSSLSDSIFLSTLLKDYYFYHQVKDIPAA
jgi:uncharacterized RDD family membrane protein YckC